MTEHTDRPDHRSGSVVEVQGRGMRAVGWGMLGGMAGVLFGLLSGIAAAPPADPDYPLANEWYPVGVLFGMALEGMLGLLLGVMLALRVLGPSRRRALFLRIVLGAVLGILVGFLVGLIPSFRSGLLFNFFLQVLGACLVAVGLSKKTTASEGV